MNNKSNWIIVPIIILGIFYFGYYIIYYINRYKPWEIHISGNEYVKSTEIKRIILKQIQQYPTNFEDKIEEALILNPRIQLVTCRIYKIIKKMNIIIKEEASYYLHYNFINRHKYYQMTKNHQIIDENVISKNIKTIKIENLLILYLTGRIKNVKSSLESDIMVLYKKTFKKYNDIWKSVSEISISKEKNNTFKYDIYLNDMPVKITSTIKPSILFLKQLKMTIAFLKMNYKKKQKLHIQLDEKYAFIKNGI